MPFDPSQPFEEVAVKDAPAFDPAKPFEADGPDWKPLYSGLDEAPMDPKQAGALNFLGQKLTPDKETRAQAINQSYVQSKMPGWQMNVLQQHWPTVRDGFAKESGFTQGEPITDSALYGHIANDLTEQDQKRKLAQDFAAATPDKRLALLTHNFGHLFKLNAMEWWAESGKPFKELPEAPQMPDIPAMGLNNPAIVGGIYNSMVKPFVEGLESPLTAGTVGLAGGLSAAKNVGIPLAKQALAGISGLFAGLMAKSAAEKVPEAAKVVQDPNATLQEKVQAVGAPVMEGALGLLAGFHTISELAPEPGPIFKQIEGKTPAEAAQVLRQEANKTTEAPLRDTLEQTAAKLEEIPSPKVEDQPRMVEDNKIVQEFLGKTDEQHTVGVRNADVDRELKAMGREPATRGESLTFKEADKFAEEAMKADPLAGSKLVDELSGEARAISGNEDALLLRELNRRWLLKRDLGEQLKAAEGKPEATQLAEKFKQAEQDYVDALEVDAKVGTESSHSLSFRRMRMKEDYSLQAMEQKLIADNDGAPLSPEQMSQVEALSKKLEESQAKFEGTQKAFDEYKSRMSELLMEESPRERPAGKGKPPAKWTTALSAQADAARIRIRERMASGQVSAGIDPALIADHAIIGADYIARGVGKFADWSEAMLKEFGDKIKPHLQEIFEKSQARAAEEKRLATYRMNTEKLRERVAKKDVEPKVRKEFEVLDKEARLAEAEREAVKQQFDQLREKARYEKSSKISKATQQALSLYDTARLLMTTGEFSFILRQGKMGVLSHPIVAAKILPDTFRALMANPVEAHALNLKVLNHPDAVAAKAAKLHLLEEGQSLHKQEEILMGKLAAEHPVLTKTVGKFNQAATVFLNRLRFDMFESMRKSSGGLDAAEQKQLAMFVNEATGRGGLGPLEVAAVPLGRLMFAPRYLASRLQIATGHALWGGTWETRRIIAKEYARTLIGLSLYYTGLLALLQQGNKDVEVGTDPRSSDFGKIKIGNTRLDPLAGVSQVVTFGARTISGETVNGKGKERDIRGENVPYGGDKWSDVAARFARSKLHPVPGAIVNLFDGTDLGGNPADITNQALNLSAPLTYMDIYQALEEQDLPEGVSLGLLAMLGEGLQTYDANKSRKPLKTVPRE